LGIIIMASFLSNLFACSDKKSTAESKPIYPKEEFAMIEAKLKDGRPLIAMINKAYRDYERKSDYPWCLKIHIGLDLDKVYDNGLPLPDEHTTANRFEDELMSEVKKLTTAHYIGHVFNDNFLDIYVYLEEPEKVRNYLQQEVNKKDLIRAFGYEIEKDKKWKTVDFYLNAGT